MRSLLLLFFLPFFLLAKPFKVATYNVENLFDADFTGTEYEEYTPKHNWTARMVEVKLNHTAEVICDLDADILGLQEIENDTVLTQLQKRLDEVGCSYPYRAITHKKGTPIQVALLSRFPINAVNELQISQSPGVRNILEADVRVEKSLLKIFVNHWKSRSREGWESKRIVSAEALQKRLQKLPKDTEYLLIGDFNTDEDAYLGLERRINDTLGKTGLHHILNISHNGYLVEETSMAGLMQGVHYTLWQELPVEERWNTKFYSKRGTPDHIVLPSSMFDGKGIDYLNDSFKVLKKGYLFTKRGYINCWEYKKDKHWGRGYSDHLPVYAYFDTKPYQKTMNQPHHKREVHAIEYLYTKETLQNEIILEDAVVIWKEHANALIKQHAEGRGVFLFACASKLDVGKKYDLLVRSIKSYYGLKEITHIYVLNEKEDEKISKYFLSPADLKKGIGQRQNEIVHDIIGVYKDKHLFIGNLKIPIHFKKQTMTPPEGSKLKIAYAHVGYYKKLQLVVYSPKDFQIME